MSEKKNHDHIFLDNSVLGRIWSRTSKVSLGELFKRLIDKGALRSYRAQHLMLSAHNLIELLGLTTNFQFNDWDAAVLTLLDRSFRNEEEETNAWRKVVDLSHDYVVAGFPYTFDALYERAKDKSLHLGAEARKDYENFLLSRIAGSDFNNLIQAMRWDLISSTNLPLGKPELRKNFSLQVLSMVYHDLGVPVLRANLAMIETMIHVYSRKADSESRSKALMWKANLHTLDFCRQEDKVDVDICHLAAVGKLQGSPQQPTICLTCDDKDQTKQRVISYQGALQFLTESIQAIRESIGVPYDSAFRHQPTFRPGSMIFLSTDLDFFERWRL